MPAKMHRLAVVVCLDMAGLLQGILHEMVLQRAARFVQSDGMRTWGTQVAALPFQYLAFAVGCGISIGGTCSLPAGLH